MKIAILEDEMIVVRDLKSRLRQMGYEDVIAFDTGKDFLGHIERKGVDLCLVDVNINEI